MLTYRLPLALAAALALLLPAPTVAAQSTAAAQITITDVTSAVTAGDPFIISFDLSNMSGGPIDKVVAAVVDPKGRTLTPRNLYTRDIKAGDTISQTSRQAVPSRSNVGTYQVQVQALTADGTVVGTADTAFDVVGVSDGIERDGLRLMVDDVPAQVESGGRIRVRVSFTNTSTCTVDRVYALVVDPRGRLLNVQGIFSGAIAPGMDFERTHGSPIPATFPLGTYQVQFQARCDDGSIVASVPASFEVVAS